MLICAQLFVTLWSVAQQAPLSMAFSRKEHLSSVQLLSHVQLFATPCTAARQASLSITNSRNPPKPMSIESVMLSNHIILCCPLLLLPSIFPSIRVFSNESILRIKWPKYWSLSFSISSSPKSLAPWKESYNQPRQQIKKQRHYFVTNGPSNQGYGFFQWSYMDMRVRL